MAGTKMDLLQGTLDLLILRVLSAGPRHGYDIAKRIQLVSQEALSVGQGSLYPALHRLEKQGFIRADWGKTDTGRRARIYELTPEGELGVVKERDRWKEFCLAVELILENG